MHVSMKILFKYVNPSSQFSHGGDRREKQSTTQKKADRESLKGV